MTAKMISPTKLTTNTAVTKNVARRIQIETTSLAPPFEDKTHDHSNSLSSLLIIVTKDQSTIAARTRSNSPSDQFGKEAAIPAARSENAVRSISEIIVIPLARSSSMSAS